MRSLFWKLFGAFWLTTFVILTVSVLMSFRLAGDSTVDFLDAWDHPPLQDILQASGLEGLKNYVRDPDNFPPGRTIYLIDRDGGDIAGRRLPRHLEHRARRAWAGIDAHFHRSRPPRRLRLPLLETRDGELLLALPGPAAPPRFGVFSSAHVRWVVLTVAAVISLLIFWLLSRSLTRPVARIAATASRLAGGDMSARVGASGHDEIGQLASQFDRMADELETQSTNRREMFRNIAHELRAPLTRLQIATELLERKPGQAKEQLERIRYEIERVENLTRQVLTLAQAEQTGEADDVTMLGPVLDQVVRDAEYEAGARDVRLRYSAPAEALAVKGRAGPVASAIENVVRNAVQMTPAGGEVAVSVTGGDPRIVTVTDTGPGVSAPDLGKIFAPFYRIDTNRPGAGIGLAIAQRVLHQAGGDIAAANRPQGGLAVTMRFPAAAGAVDNG